MGGTCGRGSEQRLASVALLTGGVTRGGTEGAVEFISTPRYPRDQLSIETPSQLFIDAVNIHSSYL